MISGIGIPFEQKDCCKPVIADNCHSTNTSITNALMELNPTWKLS